MILYDSPRSCNKCGGVNDFLSGSPFSVEDGTVETKCCECGFLDYWEYGRYCSGSEMVGRCDQYYFNNGEMVVKKRVENEE